MMVPWQKEFEIGHARIDSEHRDVVDLLNELDVYMAIGAPAATIDRGLADLVRAVSEHLSCGHQDCPNAHRTAIVEDICQLRRHWHSGHGDRARLTLKLLAHDWMTHLCEHPVAPMH